MSAEIRVVADARALAREAAETFVRLAADAVSAKGSFTVSLAGGSTPRDLYRLLVADGATSYRSRIPWDKTFFFLGDERRVPPGHAESNYRMAYEELFSKVPLAPGHFYRFYSEADDPDFASSYYEDMLRGFFRLQADEFPSFDLALLGLGADGHTASLFPGSAVLGESRRLAAAVWVEQLEAHRLTLTPPVFNHAASVVFLVRGESKAEALRETLEGARDPQRLPAQLIRPERGTVLWLVDAGAASRLRQRGARPS